MTEPDPRKLMEALSMERAIKDLEERGTAPTRENIIKLWTSGEIHKWGIEDESQLPEHLQDWDAFQNGPYNHHD